MICSNYRRSLAERTAVVSTLTARARAARNPDAFTSLRAKLRAVAPRFDGMPEAEWVTFIDDLPFEEFVEYIGLGAEGVGLILDQACSMRAEGTQV